MTNITNPGSIRAAAREEKKEATDLAAARLTLRVDLGEDRAIGPGKIRLLEAIRDAGSITKAGIALAAAPSSAPASPELDELPVDIPKTRAVKRDNVTLPITGEVEQSAQIEMLGSDDITVEKDYLLPPPFSS